MRFTYLGPAGFIWPDLAVFDVDGQRVDSVPVVGDSYEWGDVVPGAASWEPEAVTVKALAGHKKADLVEIAAGEGLSLDTTLKQAEMVAAIEAHRQAPAAPDRNGGGAAPETSGDNAAPSADGQHDEDDGDPSGEAEPDDTQED
jgi:hypothetical protein